MKAIFQNKTHDFHSLSLPLHREKNIKTRYFPSGKKVGKKTENKLFSLTFSLNHILGDEGRKKHEKMLFSLGKKVGKKTLL